MSVVTPACGQHLARGCLPGRNGVLQLLVSQDTPLRVTSCTDTWVRYEALADTASHSLSNSLSTNDRGPVQALRKAATSVHMLYPGRAGQCRAQRGGVLLNLVAGIGRAHGLPGSRQAGGEEPTLYSLPLSASRSAGCKRSTRTGPHLPQVERAAGPREQVRPRKPWRVKQERLPQEAGKMLVPRDIDAAGLPAHQAGPPAHLANTRRNASSVTSRPTQPT